jgi:beta-glucanase (GH16 family)
MNDPEFSREGQNGKWSAMTNDPNFVYQTGGKFYIQGQETENTYYGGTIDNKRTMAFQYGYVEKSALVPDGPGFWSLLWFCGTGDGTNVLGSPEIDLNECFGEGKVTHANCHAWPTSLGKSLGYEHTSLDGSTYGNDKKVTCPDGKTFADDFHTYGFLWDEEYQAFSLTAKSGSDIRLTPQNGISTYL